MIALRTVPLATVIIGIKIPFRIIVSEKKPNTYEIIVLIKELKPKGMPVVQSKKIPETKPQVSP